MNESYINQITLDCLLNKDMINKHLRNKKTKVNNKEERRFYRKRIYNLFKELLIEKDPDDLLPDVKYAYSNFINSCIHYFKTIDNNDLRQKEYKDMDFSLNDNSLENIDISNNLLNKSEADKLLMRSIKIESNTLDKYVIKTTRKKKEEIILPKQKIINLQDPELKNKGLKKENINNKYEDNKNKKTQNEEK
jgi:hypothetical protein